MDKCKKPDCGMPATKKNNFGIMICESCLNSIPAARRAAFFDITHQAASSSSSSAQEQFNQNTQNQAQEFNWPAFIKHILMALNNIELSPISEKDKERIREIKNPSLYKTPERKEAGANDCVKKYITQTQTPTLVPVIADRISSDFKWSKKRQKVLPYPGQHEVPISDTDTTNFQWMHLGVKIKLERSAFNSDPQARLRTKCAQEGQFDHKLANPNEEIVAPGPEILNDFEEIMLMVHWIKKSEKVTYFYLLQNRIVAGLIFDIENKHYLFTPDPSSDFFKLDVKPIDLKIVTQAETICRSKLPWR